MWGGFEFKVEGAVLALVVFFFSTLSGILYRQHPAQRNQQKLTPSEQELVGKALQGQEDPRVIVVKQEAEVKEKEKDGEDDDKEYYEYDYPYPYYYDEDDEDDDEYEYDNEDEYED